MRTIFAIAFIISPTLTFASDWTGGDTASETTYLVLHTIDWGQTLYVVEHPDDYRETNGFLGNHPSRGKVNTWFIITGLLHVGAANWLSPTYRDAFQYITIGYQANNVSRNYSIDIKMEF